MNVKINTESAGIATESYNGLKDFANVESVIRSELNQYDQNCLIFEVDSADYITGIASMPQDFESVAMVKVIGWHVDEFYQNYPNILFDTVYTDSDDFEEW